MRVIGVDPGYERMGVAVIERINGSDVLLYSDCLTSSAKLSFPDRLLTIGEGFEKVLRDWQPEVLSIEKLFFAKNQKTAIMVAEARGMVCFLAKKHSLQVFELTPGEIKTSVTGYGQSSKNQVITMVEKLIKINKKIKHDDEYDAIAAGLSYLSRQNFYGKITP